jgi:UDP-3-O-[3-hydroxymyristoyl] glucosamine N-acyltransferase
MNPQQYRLEDLARLVQGECVGQADLILKGLASLDSAESRHLAFVNGEKYLEQAQQSKAGAFIVTADLKDHLVEHQNFIVVANPYLAFAILTHAFEVKHTEQGIESTAQIHPSSNTLSISCKLWHNVTKRSTGCSKSRSSRWT